MKLSVTAVQQTLSNLDMLACSEPYEIVPVDCVILKGESEILFIHFSSASMHRKYMNVSECMFNPIITVAV